MSTTSFQSPSVTLEKGSYRMRAPRRLYTPSKQRALKRLPDPLTQDKKLAILIVLLTSATLACFGTAYYLFTTRWRSKPVPPTLEHEADNFIQVVPYDTLQARYAELRHNPHANFLAYFPHSGFHNQRIAFENALVLSRLLNRTLLVTPVRLGDKPIRYVQFDTLRRFLSQSGKEGLFHCADVETHVSTPEECLDYFDYTLIPWDWLVDLSEIRSRQSLLEVGNASTAWLQENLGISSKDTLTLRDTGPYDYRFLDSIMDISPSKDKYLHSVYIPTLARTQERLLQVGTLFGSSRLRLKLEASVSIRRDIRRSMAFANPALTGVADAIHDALGNSYIGAHLRIGDGHFQHEGETNARIIWWKLVHQVLEFDLQETLALERRLIDADGDDELEPPQLLPDLPSLRVPHPPLPPFPEAFSIDLTCRGELHPVSPFARLNIPLFISTDSPEPRTDPVFSRFFNTFPCIFFLSDFYSETASLRRLRNEYDQVQMSKFLIPFMDAMVVAKAREIVVTDGSTFSRFVQDVLWRTYHGFEIVQRG